MPNIFDEASKATEELFMANEEEPVQEEIPATEVPTEEIPAEEVPTEVPAETPAEPTQEQTVLSEAAQTADVAAQTADVAAQVAAEKDAQLQQVMRELEAIKQQNASLQGAIDEMSRINEEHIIEEALEPPSLDIGSLAFADEATVQAAQAKYAADMAEYNRQTFMKEFAPVIEQANKAKLAEEKNDVISALSQVPELKGIENMLPQLDRIIANNKALSSEDIPLDEKYITAFAIATGVNALNNPPAEPKEPTTEELFALYNSNPELQEMVEKQRLSQVKQHQQVPPFSASSGAVNAALNIPEEPKGWDDASERTRKMFGMG